MSEIQEGDEVLIKATVLATHPEWIGVRVLFGRHLQNVRIPRDMVYEPPKAEKKAKGAA